LSSLSASVITEVAECETASDCWLTLQEEFASSSRAQVLAIQQKLQNLKKGGKSFSDYIAEINGYVEGLSVAGRKMDEQDLVLLVVAGLGDEYETLSSMITVRRDNITWKEVKAMFMDTEVRNSRSNTLTPLSANVVEAPKVTKQGKVNYKTIPCQICSVKGHGALNCYNRINLTKFPPTHGRVLSPNGPTGKMSANLTYKKSSGSIWYPDQGTVDEFSVNMVMTEIYESEDDEFFDSLSDFSTYSEEDQEEGNFSGVFCDSLENLEQSVIGVGKCVNAVLDEGDSWYADSGATNHVIKSQQNVQQSLECNRTINTADGRPMNVTHYGNSVFFVKNKMFDLNQLLYVPSASKNLISVSEWIRHRV